MENTNEIANVEWQYSEFPNVYYYFCGKCGSGIQEGTEICPFCKCKEDWLKVPKCSVS